MVALAAIYLLLRGRLGLVLTAIRDDEVAARSSGARVGLARMLVFVVAGAGCGAAGAVLAISQLQVQPSAVFSVQWTAEMAFATIIGGLGTIEGPIIGTVVYMVLQQTLASYNAWYLIILGLVAIVVALFARRGLWGLVDDRLQRAAVPGRVLAADRGRRARAPCPRQESPGSGIAVPVTATTGPAGRPRSAAAVSSSAGRISDAHRGHADPAGVSRHVDGRGPDVGGAADRRGHRAQALLEFLVDDRVPLPGHLAARSPAAGPGR